MRKTGETGLKIPVHSSELIGNLDKIGPWSTYYLAEEALRHYYPHLDYNGETDVCRYHECLEDMGLEYWDDVIEKYQKEVGYGGRYFSKDYVNEA